MYIESTACLAHWVSIPTLQYGGGEASTAPTLEDCQQACEKKQTCVGIDWSPDEVSARKQCYLLQQHAYYGYYALSKGVVHYDLTRTAPCDGMRNCLIKPIQIIE